MGAKKADNDNVNVNDNDYNSNSNELLCETSQTHDETINLTSFVVFFNSEKNVLSTICECQGLIVKNGCRMIIRIRITIHKSDS